ncbi:MAG: hypothetical protein E2586_02455 [Novosphingobium sp.]|uniref:hypothetical protein n=1 Tax=Novosphingobium sp. TaxID=1874826 RepID=UPI0012C1EE0B|nr:hypothetical protein [Novosphingobium sp.]MPS67347.1 hypothetical protein [Novosphingobium sp.]
MEIRPKATGVWRPASQNDARGRNWTGLRQGSSVTDCFKLIEIPDQVGLAEFNAMFKPGVLQLPRSHPVKAAA